LIVIPDFAKQLSRLDSAKRNFDEVLRAGDLLTASLTRI
jgi:hypothetical protein